MPGAAHLKAGEMGCGCTAGGHWKSQKFGLHRKFWRVGQSRLATWIEQRGLEDGFDATFETAQVRQQTALLSHNGWLSPMAFLSVGAIDCLG